LTVELPLATAGSATAGPAEGEPLGFAASAEWVANPFLHLGFDRVYNPLTDRLLLEGEPGYAELRAVAGGQRGAGDLPGVLRARLLEEGWLAPAEEDLSRRFLLKYVSLEANSHCNQACYFCPVSVAPRETHLMPDELYRRIVAELAAFRQTIEAVFMINYNEPTADPRFVEQVATIKAAGLPPAVLTNGTGLTPRRIDRLIDLGGLRFLSVNLSTLDRERYRDERGGDHLALVLRNVDYAAERQVAQQMDIVVLGTGDERHRADYRAIRDRYAGSRFAVKSFEVNDRAGYLTIGLKAAGEGKKLCGCDYVGSRPLQHLHVTPRGLCVLCCQDYNETVVVGDLNVQSVDEVLRGPALAQARRWAYGLEEAPARFICRDCRYALLRRQ
jgi:MoaA/NifB/PqqE/SkfB family radical SAM enzyme